MAERGKGEHTNRLDGVGPVDNRPLCMNSTIPGNAMNTKILICSYQLQCNVIFIGKFNLIIFQNLTERKKLNLLFNLASRHEDFLKAHLKKRILKTKFIHLLI